MTITGYTILIGGKLPYVAVSGHDDDFSTGLKVELWASPSQQGVLLFWETEAQAQALIDKPTKWWAQDLRHPAVDNDGAKVAKVTIEVMG